MRSCQSAPYPTIQASSQPPFLFSQMHDLHSLAECPECPPTLIQIRGLAGGGRSSPSTESLVLWCFGAFQPCHSMPCTVTCSSYAAMPCYASRQQKICPMTSQCWSGPRYVGGNWCLCKCVPRPCWLWGWDDGRCRQLVISVIPSQYWTCLNSSPNVSRISCHVSCKPRYAQVNQAPNIPKKTPQKNCPQKPLGPKDPDLFGSWTKFWLLAAWPWPSLRPYWVCWPWELWLSVTWRSPP